MSISLSARYQAVFEPNRFGGRLKYFGQEADSEYWDELWAQIESSVDYGRYRRGHFPLQLQRTFLRWAKPGSRVLEAGCGFGTFTVAANALGYKADGVDFAPNVISQLNQKFPDIDFFVGDVRNLTSVADGTYDAVYSPGVCEHFESGPEEVLCEAHRLLRKGGLIVVSTPCFNAFQRFLYRLGRFQDEARGDFYQYAFSRAELASVLDGIGFDVVQIHQYGAYLTVTDHMGFVKKLLPPPAAKVVAVALDSIPGIRRIGHTCIWVGVKR